MKADQGRWALLTNLLGLNIGNGRGAGVDGEARISESMGHLEEGRSICCGRGAQERRQHLKKLPPPMPVLWPGGGPGWRRMSSGQITVLPKVPYVPRASGS